MSERDGNGGLFALILGGAIGLAAGLLLAPRKGRDTRKKLQNWIDDLDDRRDDIVAEGRGLLREGKGLLKTQTDKIRRAIDPGRRGGNGHRK